MNCPHCQTFNQPESRFCIKCGKPLSVAPSSYTPPATSPDRLLAIATGRVIIATLLLLLFRAILVRLSFFRGLTIPDFELSPTQIVTSLVHLIILYLLLNYAPALRVLWSRTFPRLAMFTVVWVVLVYLFALSSIYIAFVIPIYTLVADRMVGTYLQITIAVLAFVMLGYAWVAVYREIPSVLRDVSFRFTWLNRSNDLICLQCGALNPAGATHCTHCKQPIPDKTN